MPNGAVKSPDAAWLRLERWQTLSDRDKAAFAPICPDFVVELKSGSDRLKDVQAKMQEYIENGTALGWLIDRQKHQVHIYRPDVSIEILDHPTSVSADPIMQGFTLDLSKIW